MSADHLTMETNPETVKEAACVFGENSTLTGVYTPSAVASQSAPCALYLTAGLLHHIGPTRLHVEMARALSDQGIAGLRFDLSGVGDSETSSLGGYFVDRSVNEVTQAMDFLEHQYAHKHFVLIGLCSGADDALATAQKDARVAGVVLLNGYAYRAGQYFLNRLRVLYLPRLFMWHKIRSRINKLINPKTKAEVQAHTALAELDDDFRYIPPQHETENILVNLADAKTDLMFVYTGSEYEEYTYQGQFFAMFPRLKGNAHITEHYLKEADHTLVLKADRNKVIKWVSSWFHDSKFDRTTL